MVGGQAVEPEAPLLIARRVPGAESLTEGKDLCPDDRLPLAVAYKAGDGNARRQDDRRPVVRGIGDDIDRRNPLRGVSLARYRERVLARLQPYDQERAVRTARGIGLFSVSHPPHPKHESASASLGL